MAATLTAKSVLAELQTLRSESYRKTMKVHGVKEPIFGVKISDLKVIQKRAGGTNHELALELWDSGVYDARYLAALMADDTRMSPRDLQRWVSSTESPMLHEYSVAWVAAGSPKGWETALRWIDSRKPGEATAGWNTLSGIIAMRPDDELDLPLIRRLLARVEKEIGKAPDRVRYVMNGFVIAVGCGSKALSAEAVALGRRLGTIEVDMGGTACKVPGIVEYIAKAKARGSIGRKRRMVKC